MILSTSLKHAVLQRTSKGVCCAKIRYSQAWKKETITAFYRSGNTQWQKAGAGTADESGGGILMLSGIPAGGPYEILFSGEKSGEQLIPDVLVGDVWILGGQSNMSGAGLLSEAPSPLDAVRCFSFGDCWKVAEGNLHDLRDYKDLCYARIAELGGDDENVNPLGVGPGHMFAKRLFELTGVPQGVIAGAVGASCLDDWDPSKKHGGKDGSYYGALMDRVQLAGGSVRGLFWYQGEADTREERFAFYTEKTRRLFQAFRSDLCAPELPIVMAQIARYVIQISEPRNQYWCHVREQQRLFQSRTDRIAVIPTLGLDVIDGLHLTADGGANTLGAQAADAMLTLIGYPGAQAMPIELESIRADWDPNVKAPLVRVRFRSLEGELRADGQAHGFQLFQEGKPFSAISYTELRGSEVILHLSAHQREADIARKFQLSYGGLCDCYGNITDSRHRSLPGFGPLPILPLKKEREK